MISQPFRAVIFDAGGVFSLTAETGGARYWERKLGLEPGGIQQLITPEISRKADLGLISDEEAWELALQPLGLDAAMRAVLAEDFWSGAYLDYDVAYLIERAQAAGYRTALISNGWIGTRARHTARGWDRLLRFDVRMYSAEEGLKKPDAAIFLRCLERLGVRAEETLFVDDSTANAAGAREIGIQAVCYTDKTRDLAEIQRLLEIN